jgi:uncharacterized membrane protein YhaH (DUF805 family)
MNWYVRVLKKYAVFNGRASRTEYWMFYFCNIAVMFLLAFIEVLLGIANDTDQSVLSAIYQLAVLIPTVAVGCRRMHDTNHSGWWLLVPLANLILLIREGTKGDNRFGPDPRNGYQTQGFNSSPSSNDAYRTPPYSLRTQLLELLAGDTAAADRLLSHIRSRYPGQSEQWYYEKVIQDLIRDRRSY